MVVRDDWSESIEERLAEQAVRDRAEIERLLPVVRWSEPNEVWLRRELAKDLDRAYHPWNADTMRLLGFVLFPPLMRFMYALEQRLKAVAGPVADAARVRDVAAEYFRIADGDDEPWDDEQWDDDPRLLPYHEAYRDAVLAAMEQLRADGGGVLAEFRLPEPEDDICLPLPQVKVPLDEAGAA
jgi:hypothetical protein